MASFILDTPFLRLRVLCVRSWELSRSTQRKSDWMLQQFDSVFKCCCERVVTGRVEKLWSIRLQTSSPSSAVRGRPNVTSTQMDILRIYKRHCFEVISSLFSAFPLFWLFFLRFYCEFFYFSKFISVVLISFWLYKEKCQWFLSQTTFLISMEVNSWHLGTASVYVTFFNKQPACMSCCMFCFFQMNLSTLNKISSVHRVNSWHRSSSLTVTETFPLLWHKICFKM